MVTLLSFVIVSPPGSIQLINTKCGSIPLTVLTVQCTTCGLPTVASCIGPDDIIIGVGTVKFMIYNFILICIIYSDLPITSNITSSVPITGGLVLTTALHWYTLPSSVVLSNGTW